MHDIHVHLYQTSVIAISDKREGSFLPVGIEWPTFSRGDSGTGIHCFF